MLIRSLRAENFMKFSKLCLENIPQAGVIGVEGPNESGKTTIAEAILFGLFGRCREGKPGSVDQLIRWRADHLRVELEFELPDDRAPDRFLIVREIDRFGTNYVRLLSMPDRRELASGHIEFDRFLREKLKLDAREFQQAFCQHQTAPGWVKASLAEFVERMTGIARMESARDGLREENVGLERRFAQFQKEIGRHLALIERLAAGASRVSGLTEDIARCAREIEKRDAEIASVAAELGPIASQVKGSTERERSLSRLASAADDREVLNGIDDLESAYSGSDLRAAARRSAEVEKHLDEADCTVRELRAFVRGFDEVRAAYELAHERVREQLDERRADSVAARLRERTARMNAARAGAKSARRGAIASLVVALAAGAIAGLFAAHPTVRAWVETPNLAVSIAGGIGGLFLLIAAWRGSTAAAIRRDERDALSTLADLEELRRGAESEATGFAELRSLGEAGRVRDYFSLAEQLIDGAARDRLSRLRAEFAEFLAPGKTGRGWGVSRALSALARSESQLQKRFEEADASLRRKAKELDADQKKTRAERDRLETELRDAEAQAARKAKVEATNRELDARADKIRREIDDRLAACRLLDETMAAVRVRVGPTLGALVRAVLPHFTAGRYRDVKIGEGMDVFVFAPDLSDFVRVEELSGGTNEALFLALRLAFAQAFVKARAAGPQLLVLDEPFKMMDVSRALAALEVLRRVSPDLAQYFIIQPNYTEPQRAYFDELITTSIDVNELELSLVAR